MRFPMVQPVTEMTKDALGDRLAPGVDEYLDMFHEDAVFEFPFGLGGLVRKEGRSEMAAYLATIEGSTIFNSFDLKAAYPIRADGMVLEYNCRARVGSSGTPFEQDYVADVLTRDGRIYLYREYLNPLNVPGVAAKAPGTPVDRAPLAGPTTTLDAMLRDAFGARLDPAATSFAEMFGQDGVLECPLAPPGALRRLRGKGSIADYHRRLAAIQSSSGMVLVARYPAEDPDTALLEYDGTVRDERTGDNYRQRYLTIARVDRGQLVLFREYWNPLPVVASFAASGHVPVNDDGTPPE